MHNALALFIENIGPFSRNKIEPYAIARYIDGLNTQSTFTIAVHNNRKVGAGSE